MWLHSGRRWIVFLRGGRRDPGARLRLRGAVEPLLPPDCRLVDVRVGSRHVELDIVCVESTPPPLPGSFKRVEAGSAGDSIIALFREERYWEAHEALERVWRRVREEWVRGAILAAAAMVHMQRGREDVCLRLLRRALPLLRKGGMIGGLDVARVAEEAGKVLKEGRCRPLLSRAQEGL